MKYSIPIFSIILAVLGLLLLLHKDDEREPKLGIVRVKKGEWFCIGDAPLEEAVVIEESPSGLLWLRKQGQSTMDFPLESSWEAKITEDMK